MIAERRKELVRQITVCGVNLDHLEAGPQRSPRARGKRLDHASDLVAGKLVRRRIVGMERDGAGCGGRPSAVRGGNVLAAFPWSAHARLASGMRQLDARHCALVLQEG